MKTEDIKARIFNIRQECRRAIDEIDANQHDVRQAFSLGWHPSVRKAFESVLVNVAHAEDLIDHRP